MKRTSGRRARNGGDQIPLAREGNSRWDYEESRSKPSRKKFKRGKERESRTEEGGWQRSIRSERIRSKMAVQVAWVSKDRKGCGSKCPIEKGSQFGTRKPTAVKGRRTVAPRGAKKRTFKSMNPQKHLIITFNERLKKFQKEDTSFL